MPGDKYERSNQYDADMCRIKKWALATAIINISSKYVGIFGMTWATVVVLGGFVQFLKYDDIRYVSALLFLQSVRFASISAFGRLPTAPFFSEKHHPDDFTGRDDQYVWSSYFQLLGTACSFVISVTSIALSAFRISALGSSTYKDLPNIDHCLYAFYIITIITSTFSLFPFFIYFHLRHLDEPSKAFYEAVYRCAIEKDLCSAFAISPLNFAFKKLRSDFVRGIRPETVIGNNKRLVEYIYRVPTGLEMAYNYFFDSDMYMQLVAVNLASFWVKEDRIKRQILYFVEVGKKMERPEKLGEAACNAIDRLATEWADIQISATEKLLSEANGVPFQDKRATGPQRPPSYPFLVAQIPGYPEKNIVDMLADLVIKPVRPSLVFQVRAMESCCRSREVVVWIRSRGYYNELCKKLLDIVVGRGRGGGGGGGGGGAIGAGGGGGGGGDGGTRERTKIFAASALMELVGAERLRSNPTESDQESADYSTEYQESTDSSTENQDSAGSSTQTGAAVAAAAAAAPAYPITEAQLKDFKNALESINPVSEDTRYVWRKEQNLLDRLRKKLNSPAFEWPDEGTTLEYRRPKPIP